MPRSRWLIVSVFSTVAAVSASFVVSAVPVRAADAGASSGVDGGSQTTVVDATSAGTVAQAEQIAATFGHRVEATALDDESSTTYVNPDGTQTLEAESHVIRVRRGDGWAAVDTTLQTRPDGRIAPTTVPVDVVLGAGGATTAVTLTVSGGSVSYGWPTPLPTPELDGPVATYPGVLPGVDLVVTVSTSGAETSLVYHTAQAVAAASRVDLPVAVSGLEPTVSPVGAVSFTNADGEVAAKIGAPQAWDARDGGTVQTPGDHPAEPVQTAFESTDASQPDATSGPEQLSTSMTASTGGTASDSIGDPVALPAGDLVQTLSVPASLATDPGTVFPIVVDPTLTCTMNTTACTEPVHGYIENDGYDEVNSTYDSGRVHVGTFDGGTTKTRGLYSFSQGKSHGADLISSATLTLNNVYSWSCTARSLKVFRASQFTASVSWADPPGIDADNPVSHSYAHGYSSSCVSATEDYDVTSFVRIQSGNANLSRYYFELRAGSEADSTYWKKFHQNEKLVVNYDFTPNTPTNVRFTSSTYGAPDCVTGASRPKIDPNYAMAWQATVSDHDGGSVTADFQWWDAAASADKFVSAVTVSSGATAVLTIGARNSHFVDGHIYGFRALATDGTLGSPWSATCEFTVVDPAPSTPTSVGFASTHGTPGCLTGSARPLIDPNYPMNWQARVSDPDARTVNAQFRWWDLATPSDPHTATGSSVASGAFSVASFAALTASFVDGHSYGFQVRAENKSNEKYSAWTGTPTCEFTVQDPPPNDPAGLKFASPVAACGAQVATNSPFTLQASISDPDGRSVQALFTLYGGTEPWSYTTALAAGGIVTAKVRADLVPDGAAFTWTVRTYNGHKSSNATASCGGIANYARPPAPQIAGTGVFGTPDQPAGHIGDTDSVTFTAQDSVKYVVILTPGLSGPDVLPEPGLCETAPTITDGQPHTICASSGGGWDIVSVTAPASKFTITAQAYNDLDAASTELGSTSFQLEPPDVDHEWLIDQHQDSDPGQTTVDDQSGGASLKLSSSGTTWTTAQYPGEADDPDAPFGGPTWWGAALHLDGSGYATTGAGTSPLVVSATDSFSAVIWVRPDAASDAQGREVALSVDGAEGPGMAIGQYDGDWFFCMPTTTSASVFDGDCATVPQPVQSAYVGQWTLLVAEWDASAQQIHLYAEGSTFSDDAAISHTSTVSAVGPLEVGAVNTGTLVPTWSGDVMNPATFGGVLDAPAVSNLTCGLQDDPTRGCAS